MGWLVLWGIWCYGLVNFMGVCCYGGLILWGSGVMGRFDVVEIWYCERLQKFYTFYKNVSECVEYAVLKRNWRRADEDEK